MIGICDIEIYIPDQKINNFNKKKKFNLSDEFIEKKLGVASVSRMDQGQDTSDLCCQAFEKLCANNHIIVPSNIDVIIVCTQNPDFNLPHTSAIVHGKLDLSENCAAIDISLGCSGFVYGLSILENFMTSTGKNHGLLFTADPYSKIIDVDDKNTSLLFGDAATVTYLNRNPLIKTNQFDFGTYGKGYEQLICRDKKLKMNGRKIFNYAAKYVPLSIEKLLAKSNLTFEEIDIFLFHQGSKYITDFLIKRIGLPKEKVPYVIQDYGNTVSSSIPIMLKNVLHDNTIDRALISGFGVGFSWASAILERI